MELERATDSLGLNGFLINSHTNNEFLDDRKYWPILEAAVEDALLSTAHYDVITIFDVLEHLVEPLDTLRRLRRALPRLHRLT